MGSVISQSQLDNNTTAASSVALWLNRTLPKVLVFLQLLQTCSWLLNFLVHYTGVHSEKVCRVKVELSGSTLR